MSHNASSKPDLQAEGDAVTPNQKLFTLRTNTGTSYVAPVKRENEKNHLL